MFAVRNIEKHYGGVAALKGVDLQARPGEITGIIGPNGSGKSTLFDVVTGVTQRDAGEIYLDDTPLDTRRPEMVVQQGIARTFQVPRVSRQMTVLENLMLTAEDERAPSESVLRLFSPWHRRAIRQHEMARQEMAWRMTRRLGIEHMANELAGTLSGGQRKLVSLGMVFLMNPKVLLLDEPTAGVNPALIERIMQMLDTRRAEQFTTIVIEHNMNVVMQLCDRVYVLNAGEILAEGTPKTIQANELVKDAYLGRGRERARGRR